MSSILRKAMLPAAVAIAMAALIGAFGSGTVRTAEAVDGDICAVAVGAAASEAGDPAVDFLVERGETVGLVFRVEDAESFEITEQDGEDDVNSFNPTSDNVTVRIDSESGSGRITSKAEVLDVNNDPDNRSGPFGAIDEDDISTAEVGHVTGLNVGSDVVDTISPRWFDDADGNALDSIHAWLNDVGYPDIGSDDPNVCGDSVLEDEGGEDEQHEFFDDYWGFINFECIEAGTFHIDIMAPGDTEETGMTVKFRCGGQAESAEIKTQRSTVETDPTDVGPSGFGSSLITVTVFDQFGDRLDGAEVTFTTDNCHFDAGEGISPAGGGQTVTTHTDTDTDADDDIVADNPLQSFAGTAEVTLDCTGSDGNPGVAHITAIVEREGADIVLSEEVNVVGAVAASGLTLTLDPDELDCGDTLRATARAVDSTGAPVSPGTQIYFTTDSSSGVVGGGLLGSSGAQGLSASENGEATALIATDPGNPGIHTVIAFVVDSNNRVLAQTSATYECEGEVAPVAPVAPTVAPPDTGTGTITPPSTGDAGLAAGSTSTSLFVLAGAVAFVLAGLASIRFARN